MKIDKDELDREIEWRRWFDQVRVPHREKTEKERKEFHKKYQQDLKKTLRLLNKELDR